MSVPVYEAVAGVLLIFVLPGFALSRAVFPEWRFRGPGGTEHAIETAAFSLVLSVSLTVVVGFALENSPGTGFSASWNDPLLQLVLFAITVIALGAAFARGAFSRTLARPKAPEVRPSRDWETLRELDRIARERGRLQRALHRARGNPQEVERLEARLDALKLESDRVKRQREAEFGE
jgi:uncharacterized membrane protein